MSARTPRTWQDWLNRYTDWADPQACWIWQGRRDSCGYGKVSWQGKRHRGAHRVSYEQMVAPIPAGLVIDHLCRNRACVNPSHLEPVTQRENVRRGEMTSVAIARTGLCKYGHPRNEANTHITPSGSVYCRPCNAERCRARSQRIRAAA